MNEALLALSTTATALIAVGCVLIAAAVAVVAVLFYLKKRREARLSMEYLLKSGEKAPETAPKAAEQLPAPEAPAKPEPERTGNASPFNGFRMFLYNKSFTAKLIQLDDVAKDWYSMLKNELLSYKKVRDRMSWKRESFRLGRKCVARFVIRGKRLCLLLDSDPAQYAGTKYRVEDLSHVKSSADTPCLYRMKSERRAQYAKELIAEAMARAGAVKTDRAEENYVLPYEETEELIARGLIKKLEVNVPMAAGDEELNEFAEDEAAVAAYGVKGAASPYSDEELDLLFDEEDEPAEEETEEPEEKVPEEEPIETFAEEPQQEIAAVYDEYIEEDFEESDDGETEEELTEPAEEAEEETEEVAEHAEAAEPPAEVRYDKSFTAKVIQLSNTSKRWYSTLKNEILSHENICDVMSWKRESFRLDDCYVVRFMVRGKTLCLLLALNPEKYAEAKYKLQNVSKNIVCADTPCMLRLKNERSVKNAVHLIHEAMKAAGTKKSPRYKQKDFYIPYATTAQLIEKGLVRKH